MSGACIVLGSQYEALPVLQVEREGLGPAPGYLLLWDRKSHALARMKNETRIDEKTCCHCSFVVVPVRD